MKIYCCGCRVKVRALLTNGAEIYPNRRDLANIPFWKCKVCRNHVGCHHKSNNPTRPLGCIPTLEIRKARQHIHKLLDPIWKSKVMKRRELYNKIAEETGREPYHTANIRSVEEARDVYRAIIKIKKFYTP